MPRGKDQDRLTGTVIELQGTISHIVNKGGAVGITLEDEVACFLAKSEKAEVNTLRIGDRLRVRGVVKRRLVYRVALDAGIVL